MKNITKSITYGTPEAIANFHSLWTCKKTKGIKKDNKSEITHLTVSGTPEQIKAYDETRKPEENLVSEEKISVSYVTGSPKNLAKYFKN